MPRTSVVFACTGWGAALLALGYALAQPPQEVSGVGPRRHADLHVRYATARLHLAETQLRRAEELAATSPGQVAEPDLRGLRSRIELLRDELEATGGQPHGYGVALQRKAAHNAVRLAEQEIADAVAVNRRKPEAISPLDVRMRELRLEIARLRAEIWDDPAFLESPTDILQMQIDQLADQVQDVVFDVDNSPAVRRR